MLFNRQDRRWTLLLTVIKSIVRKWKGKRNPSPVCNTANAVTCAGDMQDGHGQKSSDRQGEWQNACSIEEEKHKREETNRFPTGHEHIFLFLSR